MSGSVGTMRASSNKHTGSKDKMTKSERTATSQQQQQQPQLQAKLEQQSNKMQPTQEQLRLAQLMTTNQSIVDENTVKELMELTGKSENAVVIALHDTENDADRAAMMLMEGGDEPHGEWREQGGKRKRKVNSSQKEGSELIGEDTEGRNKDRSEREEKDKEGASEHHDMIPRRGRRSGGPPPRLARGRGRDRDRDRDNKERNNTEDWNNERDERHDRSGGDRGRSRGRGGYGVRRSGGPGGGRGRFNNNDKEGRSYNRVPRFERMNNPQPVDGPEIDTWTNETAETNTSSKDTDWDNWNEIWVAEEDQWTGSLDETKVFTPSQMKVPEPEPVIAEPSSSRGQRVDVGSLFIESAKFPKAPDYSKPSGDAYINHFKQAATESIKNSIGIGSSSRPPQSHSSLDMQQQSIVNSLGFSSLAQSSGPPQVGSLSSLPQGSQLTVTQAMTQLSQINLGSQESSMGSIGAQQINRGQPVPVQSRIPSVIQQQQQNISVPTSMSNMLQQRPKPQKSKLPPPSKIPASAVEMPGHIPRNPQLDLQFGIDFGSDSSSSFDFGAESENVISVESTYPSTTNGTSTVITNHLSQAGHVNKSSDGNSVVSNIMSTSVAIESQHSNRSPAVFHSSVYASSPPQNESQSLDGEQSKMSGSEPIPYSSQLDHKTGTLMTQRSGQTTQNLSSGSLSQSKNETSYSSANGYTSSSYQSHQKSSSIPQAQSYTHTSNSQPPQVSSFQGQYPASQSAYPSNAQNQFSNPPSATQFVPPTYSQNQFSGQNQFASSGSSSLPPMQHINHQSQYSSGNSYTSSGQSQYSGYPNSSSYTSHPSSQANYSSNQTSGTGPSIYPVSTQSSNSFSSQTNSYQQQSAGSYHGRDNQTAATVTTQSNVGVNFPPTAPQSSSLKPATSQTNANYNSQSFNVPPTALQSSPLANKLGESLSKITIKDTTSIEGHQSSHYDHSGTSVTTASSSLNLPSATSTALLSTGTTTTSSTSTATSITSPSRIASVPSTSKAPPNLPPGVPLMGQYIMGQSTMPPFYSVQPPLYGFEDVQLLQQRLPLQTGSYYDMSAFSAPTGTALATGRDQQAPIPGVPFSGTSADTSKMARVDAQSPNSGSQPQNAHSAAQQPLFNFHYGYYYPSMFPGSSLPYPMFPIPPVTNAAAHSGTTANSQFQKNYTSHMYATKGYEELNQAQDFSKTGYGSSPTGGGKTSGTRWDNQPYVQPSSVTSCDMQGSTTSEMTQNAYKSHTQTYDKQGFHGGTPPPFNLPLASATQAGPMGAPTTPYAATQFLPVMATHQLHHPIQQETGSSSSRGLNQTGQAKTGTAKSYGNQYWNN